MLHNRLMNITDKSRTESIAQINPLDRNDIKSCSMLDSQILQGIWTINQWEKAIIEKDGICLGIKKSSNLIGFCCGFRTIEEIEITALGVVKTFRRMGFAHALITRLLQDAAVRGIKKAFLEVKENNHEAICLYKKFGFKTIDIRRRYYKDGSNALVQRATLRAEKIKIF